MSLAHAHCACSAGSNRSGVASRRLSQVCIGWANVNCRVPYRNPASTGAGRAQAITGISNAPMHDNATAVRMPVVHWGITIPCRE